MPQLLAETLTHVAHAAARAGDWERDQEAWNLPRASGETVQLDAHRGGLDWEGFSAAHYPESRRHDLGAIVAYGLYKRSRVDGEQAAIETARPTDMDGTSQ